MKPGDRVRHKNEVGTIVTMRAQETDGSPAVYVEVLPDNPRRPHIFRVWAVDEVEVVE